MKKCWIVPLVAAMGCAWNAGAAEWFAEVETTAGAFTIRLDWENAPNGCGAFAALAEGRTDWVNPQSGKAEKGVEYFPGTAMSWVQNNAEGTEKLLLGNRGRLFAGTDGTANVSNGSGLTLEDDIRDGGGRGLAARSVAMMNAEGPDTLDGRWAVFLKDGEAYYGGKWSRIGTVASNWGVVESIAGGARDAATGLLESPATVTGVRVWSVPAEAMEAWRAGATNWPSCGQGNVAVDVSGTNGTLHCGWRPKSQYAVVHCGDLREAARNIVWMDWNEGAEEAWAELPFQATEEGSMPFGKCHFCAVAEVGYRELTGPSLLGSGYGLLTEWQWGDGSVDLFLHELDWNAGTGTVWRATDDGGWTNSAVVAGIGFWRTGAHSGELAMAEEEREGVFTYTRVYRYRLGAHGADGTGRFRMTVFAGMGGMIEVWGDYGWGKTGKVLGGKKRIRTEGVETWKTKIESRFERTGVPRGEWRENMSLPGWRTGKWTGRSKWLHAPMPGMDATLPWRRPWTRRGEDARLSGQVRNAEQNAVDANPEPWPR